MADGGWYLCACLKARRLGDTLRPRLAKTTSALSSQTTFQPTAPRRSAETSGGFLRVIFPRRANQSDVTRGQTTVSVASTEPSTLHRSEMKSMNSKCSSRVAQHSRGSKVQRRSGRHNKPYTTSPVRSSRGFLPVQPNARSHLGMHGARHDVGAAGVS